VSIVSGASTLTTTAYSPNPLSVTVGTTVTWTNNDNTSHTSTENNGLWSSPAIAPGGQFSTTFTSAGSFTYHCTIHPGMIGTVNVQ
jgi:plastocyanin